MSLCVSITQLHPFSTHIPYVLSPVLFNSKHLLFHRFCGSGIWTHLCWCLWLSTSHTLVVSLSAGAPVLSEGLAGRCGLRAFRSRSGVCEGPSPAAASWGLSRLHVGFSGGSLCSCSHASTLITENPI